MNHTNAPEEHTAAFAEAFFIANLIFVGLFYVALWVLYLLRYQQASAVTQSHLKQTLIASSISTGLFASMNLTIWLSSGYASLPALVLLEVYFMLIAPLFLIFGMLGFIKAVNKLDYRYPLIGPLIS